MGVQAVCVYMCFCLLPTAPFANHIGPLHKSRSPSRTSNLGGRRKRENGHSPGPSSLPVFSLTPVPCLLSPFATAWTLGKGRGNLSEEGKRLVAGSGFQPSQRQAAAVLCSPPGKGDPASCWQLWDRCGAPETFHPKAFPVIGTGRLDSCSFPAPLSLPGVGALC